MNQPIQFLTPVGRLVQGHCFIGQDKDRKGKPYVVKRGPNEGQPYKRFFIALAIPKTDAGFAEMWAKMNEAAKAAWPQYFDAQGQCTLGENFSWKYTDGDSQKPNKEGRPPCEQPGFAGNHILRFSQGFPFPVYRRGSVGNLEEMTDSNAIKRGYFIRIVGAVKGNDTQDSPGIYLNIGGVEFVAYGEEIRTGPDYAEQFQNAPALVLPTGASATPLAPVGPSPAGMGATPPAPGGPLPGAPSPATPVAPTAQVRPVPGFVTPPAAPAAEKKYIVEGQMYTEAQLIGFGWTPEQVSSVTPV